VRVTAPAGFGRRHVAPLVPAFLAAHPDVTVSLDLSDRLGDIVNEGIDVAVRIGSLDDSSPVGIKLADNQRVVVASPAYLAARGTPEHPDDLQRHACLTSGTSGNQARGWLFTVDGAPDNAIHALFPQRRDRVLQVRRRRPRRCWSPIRRPRSRSCRAPRCPRRSRRRRACRRRPTARR
jgi:DNA-binding transcriptional LysR family regulator